MENNHHIHTPRPLYLIDFEWAKLAINFGHGVINVRKGEENRQTNSSVALAELMIIVEHERKGRGGGGLTWIMLGRFLHALRQDKSRKLRNWEALDKGGCVSTVSCGLQMCFSILREKNSESYRSTSCSGFQKKPKFKTLSGCFRSQ